jgi:hypothetical protein
VFTGRLIPKKTYEQLERDRDFWRTAAMKSIGHTEVLLPAAQITTEITRAFSDVASRSTPIEKAVEQAFGGVIPPKIRNRNELIKLETISKGT